MDNDDNKPENDSENKPQTSGTWEEAFRSFDEDTSKDSIFDLLDDIDAIAKREGRPSSVDKHPDDYLMSPEAEQAAMEAMDRLFAKLESATQEPPQKQPVMVIVIPLDGKTGADPLQQLMGLLKPKNETPAMQKYREAFDQQKRMRTAKDGVKQRDYPLKLVSLNESIVKKLTKPASVDYLHEVK